jgi:two-component system response regulator NreC
MSDMNERSTSIRLLDVANRFASRPYARRGVTISAETIRVLIADDHKMMREGLRLLLRGAPDVVVVGEADDGEAAVALAKQLVPQVVLMDVDMKGMDGLAALREIRRVLPDVRVLILTMYGERDLLLQALDAGAGGYLTKEAASQDLLDAIRVVASGEIYVRPSAARLLASAVVSQKDARTASSRFSSLSEREQLVLRLVAEGFSGAEIARQLGISTKTVAAYKERIREKVGLDHRTAYVRFALEARILSS